MPHAGRSVDGPLPRRRPDLAPPLAEQLAFCLRGKFKQTTGPVRAMATARLEKNERGRLRVAGIDVVLSLSEKFGDMPHQERCLEQFEDFCNLPSGRCAERAW